MVAETSGETCSIAVGTLGDASIIEVAGEVDVATVSMLAKALGDAAHSGKGDLILDAQKLVYIDSAGIQTLLSTQQKLRANGRALAIVGCHGIFHKLMQVGRFDTRFPMYSTIDEALMRFGSWDVPTV